MPFELKTPTAATLKTVTPRTEIHGDEPVSAISLGLCITGPNTLLDALDGGKLRNALYMAVPDQDQLPGVEQATPLLRARGIEEVKCSGTLEGWIVRFEHGIDDTSAIVLGGSKVDRFRVLPMEGGSVDLLFRVGTSDISEEEAGALFGKLGQEVMISITPPVSAPPAIDGSTDAFKADHPDAGDLFAAEHGDDDSEGDPDEFGEESEGGDADIDAAGSDDQPADPERGENWPFGTNSGADGTNEANGETEGVDSETADFEAGAAAAIAKAGVKPARRRREARQ